MKAPLITIEGSEGVGKSTNISLIESILREHNITFELTREPGGTPMAEEIRELLLCQREETVDPNTELLLMFASRVQHVNTKIKPLLEQNIWVISDRFTDASFAYQGGGRTLPWQRIQELEQWCLQGFKPTKTLLLDVDPEIGMKRASARGELDRFESEKMNFFEQVRAGYHRRVDEDPERFWIVDAGQTLSAVQDDIRQHIESFIQEWQS